jgi:uncharacterized protein involved in type VI secretion and phage assembly
VNGQRPPFYGKYRGTVTDNRDPSSLGRLRAKVPDVLGEQQSGWAMPAVPFAGKGVGLFLLPPVDALVWVEFEHGDPDYPIWTGCFWGASDEVPASPATVDQKVLKTGAVTVTIDDSDGNAGITVETGDGAKLTLDSSGITIDNGQGGKITLDGTQVSVNDGALEVT